MSICFREAWVALVAASKAEAGRDSVHRARRMLVPIDQTQSDLGKIVAKDKFHNSVKNALIKEEWTITDDPLFLQFGGVDLFVDLGAEKMIAAQKDNRRIAVEIKSFLGASLISEFHTALGQLMSYRLALKQKDPQRALYLAVPLDVYSSFQLREVHQNNLTPHPFPTREGE